MPFHCWGDTCSWITSSSWCCLVVGCSGCLKSPFHKMNYRKPVLIWNFSLLKLQSFTVRNYEDPSGTGFVLIFRRHVISLLETNVLRTQTVPFRAKVSRPLMFINCCTFQKLWGTWVHCGQTLASHLRTTMVTCLICSMEPEMWMARFVCFWTIYSGKFNNLIHPVWQWTYTQNV